MLHDMLNIKISLQFIVIAGDAVNTKARIRLIAQIQATVTCSSSDMITRPHGSYKAGRFIENKITPLPFQLIVILFVK
jgi:hypothetical protein